MPAILFQQTLAAQAVLTADGPGNTYERINSVLAPGYNVVEHPECVHGSFGRHIAEVFDADINQYAYEFYAHVAEDNDRCINLDRQRIEIKTYDQSPDSLIGTTNEFITYKWRFKIPVGFKASSSFTHIHQIKPVAGDDDQPLFTLTVRKGTPTKLELIYVANGSSGSNKVAIVNLSDFEGVWVEATEQVFVNANGSYSMQIKRLSDNATLLNYSNSSIATIRPDNSFIRPKWGIYRSLNTPADLRDESIRFSMFSIKEGVSTVPVKLSWFDAHLNQDKVITQWQVEEQQNIIAYKVERSTDAVNFESIATITALRSSRTYQHADILPLPGTYFYRIRIKEAGQADKFSATKKIKYTGARSAGVSIFPNPFSSNVNIDFPSDFSTDLPVKASITSMDGKIFFVKTGEMPIMKNDLIRLIKKLTKGSYRINVYQQNNSYSSPFVKL